ncbi:MAG: hypothetical protein WDZ80_06690 [Candidatus Paceibacterota bacterium]
MLFLEVEYENAKLFLEERDSKEITITGLVVYFLAKDTPGNQRKISAKALQVFNYLEFKEIENIEDIGKVFYFLEKMSDNFILDGGKAFSRQSVESILKKMVSKINFENFAIAVLMILQVIFKSVNLKNYAQLYLSESDFYEIKEFLI